jgi:ABC-2 type transport system ATP-binding protein
MSKVSGTDSKNTLYCSFCGKSQHEVRKLINKMAADKCIIISTHILEEVEAICTRTIIIARGKILADSTPAKLKEKYGDDLNEVFRKITATK